MSIEAMYPSRRQPRSLNPLFAREQRRQKFTLMLIMAALGLGLLLLQLVPVTAHANAPVLQTRPAAVAVRAPGAELPAAKPVRLIQLYDTGGTFR